MIKFIKVILLILKKYKKFIKIEITKSREWYNLTHTNNNTVSSVSKINHHMLIKVKHEALSKVYKRNSRNIFKFQTKMPNIW